MNLDERKVPKVADTEPVYLDEIAYQIGEIVPGCPLDLLRVYALLARVSGPNTTLEHVHDAWGIWRVATRPDHPALVPFARLSPEVRQLDAPYRDAIRKVASRVAIEEDRHA
jgi:hypothetical protein